MYLVGGQTISFTLECVCFSPESPVSQETRGPGQFMGEVTEAQRGQMICWQSQG